MASASIVERYRAAGTPARRGLSGLEITEEGGKILVREGRYYTALTRGIFGGVIVVLGVVIVGTFAIKFPPLVATLLCLLDVAFVGWLLLMLSRHTRPGVFFEVDGQTGELTLRAGQSQPRRMPLQDLQMLLCRKIELTDGTEFLVYAVDKAGLVFPITASVVGAESVRDSVRQLGALLDRPAYAVDSHALWRELVASDESRLRDPEAPSGRAALLYAP